MSVAAVILAAGEGKRFGDSAGKLRADLGGRSLLDWAVQPAIEAGLDEVVVVVGAVRLDDLLGSEVTVLCNESWMTGQASSLRAGIDWCARQGHEAVVVGLGDTPGLGAGAWRAVAAAAAAPIVIATYGGRRGHPVRLAADVWPLLPVGGDEGARALFRGHQELVMELACDGDPSDIDTPEELRRRT